MESNEELRFLNKYGYYEEFNYYNMAWSIGYCFEGYCLERLYNFYIWVFGCSPKLQDSIKSQRKISSFYNDIIFFSSDCLDFNMERRNWWFYWSMFILIGLLKNFPLNGDVSWSIKIQLIDYNHIALNLKIKFEHGKPLVKYNTCINCLTRYLRPTCIMLYCVLQFPTVFESITNSGKRKLGPKIFDSLKKNPRVGSTVLFDNTRNGFAVLFDNTRIGSMVISYLILINLNN